MGLIRKESSFSNEVILYQQVTSITCQILQYLTGTSDLTLKKTDTILIGITITHSCC